MTTTEAVDKKTTTEAVDKKTLWTVIWASSIGTLIEWYDFYLFGTLTAIISVQFFPSDNPTAALLAALAAFAAGFLVRPFGALFFGRLGDLIGRKYTFLVTLLIMGLSTVAIGLVPGYKTFAAAPFVILLLRLLQGLALGGEYGGAATYVSEHVTAKDRGYYTSFIQTTATLGLFLALGVIWITKKQVGAEAFADWGWRIPFLISSLLVAVSVYIRLKMAESPLFSKIKAEGKISTNPLKESFGKKENLKMVLLALFGATAGQGVVWYTGQFYANSFIQNTLKVQDDQRISLMLIAIALATPFFVVFGGWSDKVGRKWIMMAGMLLAICTYFPIYKAMDGLANGATKTVIVEQSTKTVKVTADVKNPLDSITTTAMKTNYTDGTYIEETKKETKLADASKPAVKPDVKKTVWLNGSNYWLMMFFVFIQILYVTMVYGPIAAFLVELFPTRIRYTSMSLPYHVGNGIFGGLTPFIATALAAGGGAAKFDGLYYPIAIATLCLIVGSIFLSNKINEDVVD
jgi:MFS family permease